jgi:sulfur-oxidizing protein SoxY
MTSNSQRRRLLKRIAALLVLPFAAVRPVRAQTEAVDLMVLKVTGGVRVQEGRVKLDIPMLADNGYSVSLMVSVDSPMTDADHVKSIHLYAARNPRPNIANFYLGPRAGRAQLSTRIRLGGTQRVLAVAALSDGSFWSGKADVAVTSSACWDES